MLERRVFVMKTKDLEFRLQALRITKVQPIAGVRVAGLSLDSPKFKWIGPGIEYPHFFRRRSYD
jgi:hypothetical protein